ncbi:MAG TPA: imidazole glycerol phosphate synthase subunit HisH, partial [Thermoanaerobaculia bacterium]|nr:imidazole glycerol phosphate synthase subunit HisH [Thermoanaerobaculia bacterium]
MSARRSDGVVIVDLGTGNLGNLERALAMAGGAPRVSTDPAVVAAARCLVLPGVGAFRPARERLRGPLEAALRAALASGASLLGICLGYQLLFDGSDEDGETDGLGLLPGRVRRLADLVDGGRVPVPQVGWNRVTRLRPHPVLDAMAGAAAYFVHSYAPEEVPEPLRLATTWHGRELLSAAARGRVVGTQFHPELSGDAGQRLLRRFLETAAAADTGGDSQRPVATAPAPAVAMVEGGPVPFELFPALDLRQGKVVRLLRGDDAQRTVYGDDPLAVAAAFARAGAGWLHVVDLDAAFGEAPQEALLGALLAMPHRPRVQLAGGLRSAAAIERALALGAERAVVGSLAVREPAAFRALAAAHPGRLVPALDVDGGRVLAAGWRERGPRWEEAAAALRGVPCP